MNTDKERATKRLVSSFETASRRHLSQFHPEKRGKFVDRPTEGEVERERETPKGPVLSLRVILCTPTYLDNPQSVFDLTF